VRLMLAGHMDTMPLTDTATLRSARALVSKIMRRRSAAGAVPSRLVTATIAGRGWFIERESSPLTNCLEKAVRKNGDYTRLRGSVSLCG
jgi:hypothetical protein